MMEFCGATVGGRTRDLILTMDALYQLSYRGTTRLLDGLRLGGLCPPGTIVHRSLVSPRWCSAELNGGESESESEKMSVKNEKSS